MTYVLLHSVPRVLKKIVNVTLVIKTQKEKVQVYAYRDYFRSLKDDDCSILDHDKIS